MAEIITATTTPGVGKLALVDWLKGLLLAVISAVLTVVYTSVQAGVLKFNWPLIASTAAITAISYILKNLGTGATTIISPPPGAGQVTVNIPIKGSSVDTTVPKTQ
jgi:hypothetical protein